MKAILTFYTSALLFSHTFITVVAKPIDPGIAMGTLLDVKGKPAEFVNVTLRRAKDSTLVKGTLSNEKGKFEFEKIPEGNYFISVSQVGYKQYHTPIFVLNAENASIKFPTITLEEDVKALKELNVRSQKPFIERQLDKLVVNVENSLVSAGSSVLEVLEKAPGVTVDQDDRISLKGKQGVIVMIDGKRSQLTSADLGNFLKGLPANSIEKIELITNPSAKYDAAGNAGIINILMKKDQKLGL